MPTITRTIGTASRNYSTMSAWEADLDNSSIYSSGDDAVGDIYNDSVFNEVLVINGGTTVGLSSVTLKAASGQGHNGTAGTGVRVVRSVDSNDLISINRANCVVSHIELNMNNAGYVNTAFCRCNGAFTGVSFRRMLCHDSLGSNREQRGFRQASSTGANNNCLNSIFYDIVDSTGGTSRGALIDSGANETTAIYNLTLYNVTSVSGTGRGVEYSDTSSKTLRNIISVSSTTSDFSPSTNANATVSHNLSSDATAVGTGSLTNKTASNQFISVTSGSENLHLKETADAVNAGVDLGTTPTGVNIDIDGRDRDAQGDVWDIGADEFVSSTTAVNRTLILNLEYLLGITSQRILNIEYQGVTDTVAKTDIVNIESLLGILRQPDINIENILSIIGQNRLNSEFTANLIHIPATNLEYLTNILAQRSILLENLGKTSLASVFGVEYIVTAAKSDNIDLEYLLGIINQGTVNIEYGGSTVATGKVDILNLEYLLGMAQTGQINYENLGTIISQNSTILENLGKIVINNILDKEFLLGIAKHKDFVLENLLGIIKQGNFVIESAGGEGIISLGSDINIESKLLFNTSQSVVFANQLGVAKHKDLLQEWLISAVKQGIIPIEFEGVVVEGNFLWVVDSRDRIWIVAPRDRIWCVNERENIWEENRRI